jgi:hypothetical protein
MSMKKLIISALILIGSMQSAQASQCDFVGFYGYALILTITFAPTGTTILVDSNCRQEALVLKEDALKFRLTGEASTYLQESVKAGRQANPELSEDQVVDKFIKVNVK